MKQPQAANDCVGVVEDDDAVRRGLCLMLEGLGMEVYAYASARDYLDDQRGRDCCACLVLDVRLPGISGIELQRQLQQQEHAPAIVFITGHGDVPMAVEAMRNGAVDFLQKPFKEQQLLDSVQKALIAQRQGRQARDKGNTLAARLACLTPREQELLAALLRGLRSKEVATELGLSIRTVEEHRANLMHKMHAATIAELVAMCFPATR
jgi:FixJ family two-component response regulator